MRLHYNKLYLRILIITHLLFNPRKKISKKHISFSPFFNKILTSYLETVRPHSITWNRMPTTCNKNHNLLFPFSFYMYDGMNKQISLSSRETPVSEAMTAASVGFYLHFKPHILMVLAQIGYTFMYIITEASFNHGMNPSVYVTYRHIVAGLVTLPFAYFMERYISDKSIPGISTQNSVKIYICIMIHISYAEKLGQNSQRLYSWRYLYFLFLGKNEDHIGRMHIDKKFITITNSIAIVAG